MTDSASIFLAILFGLGVFAIIVAIGWRSVQNRRILRLQDADGHETVIIAREDDEISSVVTSTIEEARPAPDQPVNFVDTGPADSAPAPEFGRSVAGRETAAEVEDNADAADASAHDRLRRVVSSTK